MICYVATAKWLRERATKYYVIQPLPILFFYKVRCTIYAMVSQEIFIIIFS